MCELIKLKNEINSSAYSIKKKLKKFKILITNIRGVLKKTK